MTSKEVQIGISSKVVARPIAKCVQMATQFTSKIYMEYNDRKVNAKSIMGMMALGVEQGQSVVVSADGEDETLAINELAKFLANEQ